MFNNQYKYIRLVPHRNKQQGGENVEAQTDAKPPAGVVSPATAQMKREMYAKLSPRKITPVQPTPAGQSKASVDLSKRINGNKGEISNGINTALRELTCCMEDLFKYEGTTNSQKIFINTIKSNFKEYQQTIINKPVPNIDIIYLNLNDVETTIKQLAPVYEYIINMFSLYVKALDNINNIIKSGLPQYELSSYHRVCQIGRASCRERV